MKRIISSLFAAFVAAVSCGVLAQTTDAVADPASKFSQKWTEKEKFNVTWRMAGFPSQSFTAYPKKGEFSFNSSDYCERGVHKAEYFVKDGKFMIRVVRKNNGCTVAVMIFDPATGQGVAAEEVGGQYSILQGRTMQLVE
jgi:hypothetical protein